MSKILLTAAISVVFVIVFGGFILLITQVPIWIDYVILAAIVLGVSFGVADEIIRNKRQ